MICFTNHFSDISRDILLIKPISEIVTDDLVHLEYDYDHNLTDEVYFYQYKCTMNSVLLSDKVRPVMNH